MEGTTTMNHALKALEAAVADIDYYYFFKVYEEVKRALAPEGVG
jgi:hypothetical protein